MKKALTIYVDDDVRLGNYCAAFVCWDKDGISSVTMQNTRIPEGKSVLYLPFKCKEDADVSLFTAEEWDDWQDAIKNIAETEIAAGDRGKAKALGQRIKNQLDTVGMKQKDLAKILKCTKATISRYVTGERIPNAAKIVAIAKALDTTVENLMEGIEG